MMAAVLYIDIDLFVLCSPSQRFSLNVKYSSYRVTTHFAKLKRALIFSFETSSNALNGEAAKRLRLVQVRTA